MLQASRTRRRQQAAAGGGSICVMRILKAFHVANFDMPRNDCTVVLRLPVQKESTWRSRPVQLPEAYVTQKVSEQLLRCPAAAGAPGRSSPLCLQPLTVRYCVTISRVCQQRQNESENNERLTYFRRSVSRILLSKEKPLTLPTSLHRARGRDTRNKDRGQSALRSTHNNTTKICATAASA